MKTINKIMLGLLFFLTIQMNASIDKETKTELISKMSQDGNVQTYVINELKIKVFNNMIGPGNYSKLSESDKDEYIKNMNILIQTRNKGKDKMYMDYPELSDIDVADREGIFEEIIKTEAVALNVQGLFLCIGSALTATAANLGAGYAIYRRYMYIACLAIASTAELAAASAVGPIAVGVMLDTGVELEIIEADAVVCAEISFEVTATAAIVALGSLSTAIGTCYTQNK